MGSKSEVTAAVEHAASVLKEVEDQLTVSGLSSGKPSVTVTNRQTQAYILGHMCTFVNKNPLTLIVNLD